MTEALQKRTGNKIGGQYMRERLSNDSNSSINKMHRQTAEALRTGVVRNAVQLPPGARREEFIASHMLLIYEGIERLVSVLEEFCTEATCPCMSMRDVANNDTDNCGEEPMQQQQQQLSAITYSRDLTKWAHRALIMGEVLPPDGKPFAPYFEELMKSMLTRFLRIYAHAYHCHLDDFRRFDAEEHLNCGLAHIVLFSRELGLVGEEEMLPLHGQISALIGG
eukprot:NODE_15844_length_1027_cov_3.907778.p1 GENE.NODE_15844_length_1027_cov_3.907778~~NODE_15844_length_1027_cov_3.907778.p1  ORF type:complete len:222 (+),score=64.94 NODE_15844_length_1027_cov_3.907778:137-802(+)